MSDDFKVERVDHVELFVPDQYEAATWYTRVFGLEILPKYEFWASDGPLMIGAGSAMLALFKGDPSGKWEGFRRVAFGVSGAGFLAFLDRLPELQLAYDGAVISRTDAVDHTLSWSVYFSDPYGYRIEITTYDYDDVKTALGRQPSRPNTNTEFPLRAYTTCWLSSTMTSASEANCSSSKVR